MWREPPKSDRRDKPRKEKSSVKRAEFISTLTTILDDIQAGLFAKAKAHREENTRKIDSMKELTDFFTPPKAGKKPAKDNEQPDIHGGFAMARFSMDVAAEAKLKDDLGVTVRCIPLEGSDDPGPCVLTGKPATKRVVFAKAY